MNKANDPVRALTPARTALEASRARRECIEFLIEVSGTDPSELVSSDRPGDVLNFVSKLYRFGLKPAVVEMRVGLRDLADQIETHPKRTLDPLIAKIRTLLDAAADGRNISVTLPAGSKLCFSASYQRQMEQEFLEYSPQLVHRLLPGHSIFTLGIPSGSPLSAQLAVFIFHAMLQLDSEEGSMVRRCQRESCHRVFLAGRPKQIFCTRKCAGAVAFERYKQKFGEERYQARHRESAKESARKSRAYKKRQQKARRAIEVK